MEPVQNALGVDALCSGRFATVSFKKEKAGYPKAQSVLEIASKNAFYKK